MKGRLYQGLGPVRRRQQIAMVVRSAVLGLLAGSVAGIGLGAWKLAMKAPVSPAVALAVLAAGPVLGSLIGAIRGLGWNAAASAVDVHYRLKDRSATALDFLGRPSTGVLHQLQIADAERHMTGIEPREVVPFRVPKALPYAIGS